MVFLELSLEIDNFFLSCTTFRDNIPENQVNTF
jgi:hypothetical protein